MRVEFIQIDAGGRTGADNPLTKDKVRQAVAHAVDRPTMAKQLMQVTLRRSTYLLSDTVRLRR